MNNYKIVFLDIEKTLIGSNRNISIENIMAIKKITTKNILTVLTSSRAIDTIIPIAKQINALPYVIANGGAIVKDIIKNNSIFYKTIEKNDLIAILKQATSNSTYIVLDNEENHLIENVKYGLIPGKKDGYCLVNSFSKYLKQNDNISACHIIGNSLEFLQSLKNNLINFNVYLEIRNYYISNEIAANYPGNHYILSIYPANISKKEGIDSLLKYLNINKEEAIAIGDSLNDLDMFDAVGYKVAMENGEQILKAKADFITLDTDHSGVAHALNKIFNLGDL